MYAGYTCVFNVLDMPSVAVPVTLVNPLLDCPEEGYQPKNDIDRTVYEMYDSADTFKGMPIGLQVVGRRWREEEALGLAKVVDAALRHNLRRFAKLP